jgi:succinyl-diaminopimelate desuccinylase
MSNLMTTTSTQKKLIELTSRLIDERSITPDAAGCFDYITAQCESKGLYCKRVDRNATQNLLITTHQAKRFSLLLSGHVDVVPPGDITKWRFDPFQATIADDILYGRGAVDMKSSVAALLMAVFDNLDHLKTQQTPVAILLTSDEEGDAIDGTQYAMAELTAMGYLFDYALVGEPTSVDQVGDTVKIGRRGSLTGRITLTGQQSHVAYASEHINPLFALSQFIHEARHTTWDLGCDHFSKTQFCVVSAQSHCVATNVTPHEATCVVNFRYCPASSDGTLRMQINALLKRTKMDYRVEWVRPNHPFLSGTGLLTSLMNDSAVRISGIAPVLSTSGGTSDARYISEYVKEIIEFGPRNHCAHQIDEHISLHDLQRLFVIYREFVQRFALKINTSS